MNLAFENYQEIDLSENCESIGLVLIFAVDDYRQT